MDIDPKPKDEQPTVPPAELELPESPEPTPDTSNEEPSFSMPDSTSDSPDVEPPDSTPADTNPAADAIPEPTGTPNPVIAVALDQEAAEDKEPQTQPRPSVEPAPEKKSRKGLIIAILIVVILGVGAGVGAWYVLYGSTPATTNNTSTESDQDTVEAATAETTDALIDEMGDALVTNAIEEETLSGTDDSTSAIDASTSTGNVGDSVNESNF